MGELITVGIVITIIVTGWIALCVNNEKSIIKGVGVAVFIPTMIVSMCSLFVWVAYSFFQVLGG